MRIKLLLTATILLVFAVSFLARGLLSERDDVPPHDTRECRRIVSMAPSITETLFALGLGDRVVGVTRFCKVPPEAQTRAKIGGFFDPNFEALVALKPDLVVMLVENEKSRPALKKLRLRSLVVSHKTVEDILTSFTILGHAFGKQAKAEELVTDIRLRIERVERKIAGRRRPRVVFSIDRSMGSGKLENVIVAAADGFYDKMIAMAGGENACKKGPVSFPRVSSEGILWMNPEVIIDIARSVSKTRRDAESIRQDWQQVADVGAVKNGRVYVLDDDFASIPGPRFILLVEKLARLFHPEIDWQ